MYFFKLLVLKRLEIESQADQAALKDSKVFKGFSCKKSLQRQPAETAKESKRFQKNPKYSKRTLKIPKESKRIQKNPKESKKIQKIPKDSKRFQKIPNESKRF